MEMFDTHRRDILNFDNYMDLKKPGFGGPQSAIALRDDRGSKLNKSPKLDGYQRTVERDPAFSHPVYDPTYKAMTHDLVYKQEKKKPFMYDHTITGIPVVEIEPVKEGKTYTSFSKFINETEEDQYEEDPYATEEDPYATEEDPYATEEDQYEKDPYATEEFRDYGMYPKDNAELDDAESRLRSFE